MNLYGIARFAADPELVPTTNSKVCKFRLVFNEVIKSKDGNKKEIPSFLSFEAWDKAAELISKYFKKGDQIFVKSATPRQDLWEKDGVKREKIYFRLNDFGFIGNNRKEDNSQNNPPVATTGEQGESEVPF